jgi:YVTN family beta-propeller protein
MKPYFYALGIFVFTIANIEAAPVIVNATSVPISGEKLYVAVEGVGELAIFDTVSHTSLAHIPLQLLSNTGRKDEFAAPHNVQVAPNGKTIWVTVNAPHAENQHSTAQQEPTPNHAEHHEKIEQYQELIDAILVINPDTYDVIHHIGIASKAHLAHIVVNNDGTMAYATAQNESVLYKIDANNYTVTGKISFPKGSEPHGLRLSPDNNFAYVALSAGKALAIVNLQTDEVEVISLPGVAVQTAVTADGKLVLISLYDTKKIAVYDVFDKTLRMMDLPVTAKGPVQLYSTPDNRFVYVADQGHYFAQPDGNKIYKFNLQQFKLVNSIKVGEAPHGIVIDKNGKFAYVTNLSSEDVSVLDLYQDKEISRIPVGHEPNGISLWNKQSGGTP